MQLVLRGKRANRYAPLGKRRIEAAKAARLKGATSALKVPGGFVISQLSGPIERVIVDVGDPYILYDFSYLGRLVPDGPLLPLFGTTEGGLIDEPFELFAYTVGRAEGLPDFRLNKFKYAMERYVVEAISTVSGVPYGVAYIASVDTATNRPSLLFSTYTAFPTAAGVNSYIQMAFVGKVGVAPDARPYVGFVYPVVSSAGVQLFPAIIVCPLDTGELNATPFATPIWPLTSLNGGRLDKLPYPSSLINAGHGRLAWIQTYDDPTKVYEDMPELVVADVSNSVYSRVKLHELIPNIDPFAYSPAEQPPDLYEIDRAELGYCGNGVIVAAVMYARRPYGPYAIAGGLLTFTMQQHNLINGQGVRVAPTTGGVISGAVTVVDEDTFTLAVSDPDRVASGLAQATLLSGAGIRSKTYVLRSTNYGVAWQLTDLDIGRDYTLRGIPDFPDERAIQSLAPGKIWLHANGPESIAVGKVFYSEDYGASWSNRPVPQYFTENASGTAANQPPGDIAAYQFGLFVAYDVVGAPIGVCGTRYNSDATVAYVDVFSGFSPDATIRFTREIARNRLQLPILPLASCYRLNAPYFPYEE